MNLRNAVLFCSAVFLFLSCGQRDETELSKKLEDRKETLEVISTLFPIYDFVGQIGKEHLDVRLLLPPGVEPHSFDPSPKDIAKINNSDIFIWAGAAMEPWVVKIINAMKDAKKKPIVVDVSKRIKLLSRSGEKCEDEENHDAENEADKHHHYHKDKDPHYWLDFDNDKKMVDTITSALAEKDPDNKDFYIKNAADYKKQLDELDKEYREILGRCRQKIIIYAGHFAFGYLAKRYGLEYISPYKGFAPNSEPTPKQMAALIKTIKVTGATHIFYEELLEPRIARAIAEHTGIKILLLHGAHNISAKELESGTTFADIMRQNLKNLKTGLQYYGNDADL
jgi:zinc transport system substrate-binding protein